MITQNVDRALETSHAQLTGCDGQSLMSGTGEIRILAGLGVSANWYEENQQTSEKNRAI